MERGGIAVRCSALLGGQLPFACPAFSLNIPSKRIHLATLPQNIEQVKKA